MLQRNHINYSHNCSLLCILCKIFEIPFLLIDIEKPFTLFNINESFISIYRRPALFRTQHYTSSVIYAGSIAFVDRPGGKIHQSKFQEAIQNQDQANLSPAPFSGSHF